MTAGGQLTHLLAAPHDPDYVGVDNAGNVFVIRVDQWLVAVGVAASVVDPAPRVRAMPLVIRAY